MAEIEFDLRSKRVILKQSDQPITKAKKTCLYSTTTSQFPTLPLTKTWSCVDGKGLVRNLLPLRDLLTIHTNAKEDYADRDTTREADPSTVASLSPKRSTHVEPTAIMQTATVLMVSNIEKHQ